MPGEQPTFADLGAAVRLRDDLQKVRIGAGNRAAAIEAERAVGVLEYWQKQEQRLQAQEDDIEDTIRHIVAGSAVWENWAKDVKGVGPVTLGLIMGEVDIRKAHSISALWRFAGYAVINGERQRPTKGQKLDYNKRLKTYVYRQMSSLMRAGGVYSKLYYRFREEEEAKQMKEPFREERAGVPEESMASERAEAGEQPRFEERAESLEEPSCQERASSSEEPIGAERANNSEEPTSAERSIPKNKMHVHLRAIRRMAKIWLSHLWVVWREAEGLPVSQPWVIEHGGHSDYIAPMTD